MMPNNTISYNDLPIWMKQAKQEFDWGVLIIIAMSLAISWTFIIHTELIGGNHLEHYVFQASDIVTEFKEGRLYPRWSPYAFNAYGAPIPNYYPMGTAYTIAMLDILFTNNIYQATRLAFILMYIIGGLGVYLLVSRNTDSAIGLLASVLYLYNPFIGLTISHVLGDLSLLIGSALLPFSLWISQRVATRHDRPSLVIYTLVIAYSIWTHPQLAIFSMLIAILWNSIIRSKVNRLQRLWHIFTTLTCGIMIASFFWLPALLERNLVTWYSNPYSRNYTISIEQLFQPIQQIDAGLLTPEPLFSMGWVSIIFAILGLFIILKSKVLTHYIYISLIIFVIVSLLFVVIVIPDQIWILAPTSLLLAIIGGHTLHIRSVVSARNGRLLMVISTALAFIFSLPVWFVPLPNLTLPDHNAISQIRYEQQGFGIATLPEGAPLPLTTPFNIPTNRTLINSYLLEKPQRFEENQNNANTIISLLKTNSHSQTYRLLNQSPTILNFMLAYFEGWQAYVDGKAIPTYGHSENGLLTIETPPASNSELTVTLEATSIREFAWVLSGIGMLALAFIIFINNHYQSQIEEQVIRTLPRNDVRLMLFMFISLIFIILISTSELAPIKLQVPSNYTLRNSIPVASRNSAGFEASSFKINTTEVMPNDMIEVTIFWQALTDIPFNYKSRVLLQSESNRLNWYIGELQTPGSLPTRRWLRNKYVSDTHTVTLPADLLPDVYHIEVEVYPCTTYECDMNSAATFFDINGTPIGRQLTLPQSITVR